MIILLTIVAAFYWSVATLAMAKNRNPGKWILLVTAFPFLYIFLLTAPSEQRVVYTTHPQRKSNDSYISKGFKL